MAACEPLTLLQNQTKQDWLAGYNSQQWCDLALQALQELPEPTTTQLPLKILLVERDPYRFLARFIAACSYPCHLFLANPDWGQSEWQQVIDLVQPDLIWAEAIAPLRSLFSPLRSQPTPSLPPSLIMIPTSGSTGKIRFAMHTWETLTASVQGLQQYFCLEQINSFCVLPLYHVSGLMQFLRSFTSGGKLVIVPFKAVEAGEHTTVDPAEFFLSLVPTQLQRLINQPEQVHWLQRFQTILLGGGPAWPVLLEQARRDRLRLAPTYGMTETASQIATLKPEDFLQGHPSCGQGLPHGQITIRSTQGEVLPANQPGLITLASHSLTLGYYPHPFATDDRFQPDDIGFLDAEGYLHVVGRNSDKIITGGENVFPAEVESALRATGLVKDVCVVGLPDRTWGQAVTAAYVANQSNLSLLTLQSALTGKLSQFKQPKRWIAMDQLPRNAQGKLDRSQLINQIQQSLDCSSGLTTG